MSKSLSEFVKEIKGQIELFETLYRKKMVENPEHYPERFESDNVGLWFEFMKLEIFKSYKVLNYGQ